jgi:transcriptional regulator marR
MKYIIFSVSFIIDKIVYQVYNILAILFLGGEIMLKDALGYKLITLLENMRSYTKQPLAEIGITHGHFITLIYISENEGVTQAKLAEIHRKDRNIVGRNIDALEKQNFVIRKRGVTDRRSFTLHLTEVGREVLSTYSSLLNTAEKEVLKNLTEEEISTFFTLLNKIT